MHRSQQCAVGILHDVKQYEGQYGKTGQSWFPLKQEEAIQAVLKLFCGHYNVCR